MLFQSCSEVSLSMLVEGFRGEISAPRLRLCSKNLDRPEFTRIGVFVLLSTVKCGNRPRPTACCIEISFSTQPISLHADTRLKILQGNEVQKVLLLSYVKPTFFSQAHRSRLGDTVLICCSPDYLRGMKSITRFKRIS